MNITEHPCDSRCLFKSGEGVIDYLNFEQVSNMSYSAFTGSGSLLLLRGFQILVKRK